MATRHEQQSSISGCVPIYSAETGAQGPSQQGCHARVEYPIAVLEHGLLLSSLHAELQGIARELVQTTPGLRLLPLRIPAAEGERFRAAAARPFDREAAA